MPGRISPACKGEIMAEVTDSEIATKEDETKKAESKAVAAKIAKNPASKGQKKYVIIIRNQPGAQGKDAVSLGDNGREYQLPRETETTITESMLNGLRDAISHETEEFKGPDGTRMFRQRPYQLYPLEIIKEIEE